MKTIFLTLLILISLSTVYSQTILKPLPLSQFPLNAGALDFEDTTIWAPRQQPHFLMGWQWQGPNFNTNKRLHCNFYQDHFAYEGRREKMELIPDSGGVKYLVWQHLRFLPNDGDDVWYIGSERGFNFDPTADTVFDLNNTVRTGDTTGAVFGFAYRNMLYGSLNSFGENFDRYSLNTASFDSVSIPFVSLTGSILANAGYSSLTNHRDTKQRAKFLN